MLFNKPFKTLSRSLVYGLFNQPIRSGLLPPPSIFTYLIDNAGNQMIANDGDELIVNNYPPIGAVYMVDNMANQLITDGGEELITII